MNSDTGTAQWIAWLAAPLSGAADHTIAPALAWHARLMVLAWAVFFPLGALAARYFKVMGTRLPPLRLDDQRWWWVHRTCQWGGILLMLLAWLLVVGRGPTTSEAGRWHGTLALVVLAVALFQVASGLLRGSKGGSTDLTERGDHFDMTLRRVWFERLHKSLGWLAILAAIPTILLGLAAADAPRWMFAVMLLWWALLLGLAGRWQRQGRCIDTYQAIWGSDPSLPGNRRDPVGWGVRRWPPASGKGANGQNPAKSTEAAA
jgi:hypothetical protein